MLKSKKFWSYEVSEHFDLTPEIISNYKLKGKFYDDALYFYDLIGTGPHPSFKSVVGKEFTMPTVLSFQNILVDINTLKILFTLLPSRCFIRRRRRFLFSCARFCRGAALRSVPSLPEWSLRPCSHPAGRR